ncbi:MAG: hypothetical protein JZD41_05625, partial [Thermoproteus sp.]|nr:hypothetical protein [Thermoproteus sp.]
NRLESIMIDNLCFFSCTCQTPYPYISSTSVEPSSVQAGQPFWIGVNYTFIGWPPFTVGVAIANYSLSTSFDLRINQNNFYQIEAFFGPFVIESPGVYNYTAWGTEVKPVSGNVTVLGGAPAQPQNGILNVAVLNGLNGSLLPARITVSTPDGLALIYSDSSTLSAQLAPGQYVVKVQAFGYTWASNATVYPGQPTNLTIVIPLAEVSVEALDSALGAPGAWDVAIYGPDGAVVAQGVGVVKAQLLSKFPNGTYVPYRAVARTPFGDYERQFYASAAQVVIRVPTVPVALSVVDRASGSIAPWNVTIYGPRGAIASGVGQLYLRLVPGTYAAVVRAVLNGVAYNYSAQLAVAGASPLQIVVPTTMLSIYVEHEGAGEPAIEVLYGGRPIYSGVGARADVEVMSGLSYVVVASYGGVSNATVVTPSSPHQTVVIKLVATQTTTTTQTTTITATWTTTTTTTTTQTTTTTTTISPPPQSTTSSTSQVPGSTTTTTWPTEASVILLIVVAVVIIILLLLAGRKH